MNKLQKLTERAREFYQNGDPGHDFLHIQRVMGHCRKLASTVEADLEMLLPAALLHDVVNLPKNHPERLAASKMAAEKSRQMLQQCEYSEAEIQKITGIIIEHSYSLAKKPSNIESALLQDADKLDALGAIGTMRAITCGCRLGTSYYDQEEPFPKARELDDKKFTIDHFYSKLLKLPDLMNTEAAKKEALKRAKFMRQFLEQLANELE